MIQFTKGQTETFVLTLTEKVTMEAPHYLFVFENMQKERVAFVLPNAADESQYIGRYNQFTIAVDDYFLQAASGLYSYKVYEQQSEVNTSEAGLRCLETGFMKLSPAAPVSIPSFSNNPTRLKAFHAE